MLQLNKQALNSLTDYKILCIYRRISNCAGGTEERQDTGEGEQDVEGGQGANTDKVVTPPDNMVAQELVEGPEDIQESNAASSVQDAVKAVKTGVHLQETKKPCMTPAAQQREAYTNTMINFTEKVKSNQEDEVDDELDLKFAGIAKQMHLHLDAHQRQRVLNKIQTLVGNCIDNVLEGLPLMGPLQVPMQQNIMAPPSASPECRIKCGS